MRARHYLQEDLNQAVADGFSTTTIESIEINPESTDVEDDVEVVPEYDEWDVIVDDKIIVNPMTKRSKKMPSRRKEPKRLKISTRSLRSHPLRRSHRERRPVTL